MNTVVRPVIFPLVCNSLVPPETSADSLDRIDLFPQAVKFPAAVSFYRTKNFWRCARRGLMFLRPKASACRPMEQARVVRRLILFDLRW